MTSIKLAAAAFAAALVLPTAAFAASAMMDCCKDCKCCDEMKGEHPAPAPTPEPAPAPQG